MKLAERAANESVPLTGDQLAKLPAFPPTPAQVWTYGYGRFDPETKQTAGFTPLPHWSGSEWRGGPERPDPKIGWVFLNPNGGHPGKPDFCAIRRWTAQYDGQFKLTGTLGHGSENGDGVRGRIVSSRAGLLGEWTVHNGKVETTLTDVTVQTGETVDFVLDCIAHETSDSFTWPVKLAFQKTDRASRTFDSVAEFHGPIELESYEQIPARIAKAWELAFTRQPSDEELNLAVRFAIEQLDSLEAEQRGTPDGVTPGRQVLVNLCQTLLNSNEFLYID